MFRIDCYETRGHFEEAGFQNQVLSGGVSNVEKSSIPSFCTANPLQHNGTTGSIISFNRLKDASLIKTEDVLWHGPFSWIGFEHGNNLKPIPDIAGVYLFTFEYQDGYILRSAGVTNSMKRRIYQHTREYRRGNYTVLDVEYANTGERKKYGMVGNTPKNIGMNLQKTRIL